MERPAVMKILLISSNICVDPYPVYPLGMSVVASALAKEGEDVKQFDILPEGMEGLRALLSAETFDLIGISIRNIDLVNSVRENAEIIRTPMEIIRICRELSSAPVFLGGAGFTLLPEVIMDCSGADFGIAGEGEEAVIELVRTLRAGKKPPRILRRRTSCQLPALYDRNILRYYAEKTHMIPVQTKRGCPCRCTYCTYPSLEGHEFRNREQDGVFRQLAELHEEFPGSLFFFVDSIFNDPCGEFRDFVRAMHEQCGRIPFTCFVTPWRLSEDDIELLCACGMTAADVGADAASDATLRGIGKFFTFDDVRRCVRHLFERGVGTSCSVMIGGPGETYDTIREGIGNLRSLGKASTSVFSGIRILPGTELYELAKTKGKIPPDWNGIDSLYYFEDGLDRARVHDMLLEAFGNDPYIIYPPDRQNRILRTIHRIGYLKFRESAPGGRSGEGAS